MFEVRRSAVPSATREPASQVLAQHRPLFQTELAPEGPDLTLSPNLDRDCEDASAYERKLRSTCLQADDINQVLVLCRPFFRMAL